MTHQLKSARSSTARFGATPTFGVSAAHGRSTESHRGVGALVILADGFGLRAGLTPVGEPAPRSGQLITTVSNSNRINKTS